MVGSVKKYEYKFIEIETSLGLDWKKKMGETQERWDELGREGWQFCTRGGASLVFMREIEE